MMYSDIIMVGSAKKRSPIPFNPAVMQWARRLARTTPENAAIKAGVSPEKVEAWETGKATPTVRQARALADFYERPFLEFFATKIPEIHISANIPDFRLSTPTDILSDHHILNSIQSWAETQRFNAIDLYEILGEVIPSIPDGLIITENTSPQIAASHARAILNIKYEHQFGKSIKERGQFPKYLRTSFEKAGIIVLKNSKLKALNARGICIFLNPLPIIIFGDQTTGGQAFTLAHELAHIVLKQSAMSGGIPSKAAKGKPASIERWCNDFAGCFLMPENIVRDQINQYGKIYNGIDDYTLNELANFFSVSRHAMLVRLVQIGAVKSSYYWNDMRPKLVQEENEYKSFGRSSYYASRYRSSNGDLYVSLVLEAWHTGLITNHTAGEFLGVKKLSHLFDIRDNFVR